MNRISDTALALLRSGKRQGVDIVFEPVTDASGQPTQITITEKDIVKNSFSIDRYSITGDKIEFGCCSAAELNFTLDNTNGKWNGFVFGGGKLTVKSRIEVNGTNQYVKLGVFYIDNMPRRLQQIEITALDRMVSLQNPVSSATKELLQGEFTLADVFDEIVRANRLSWSSEKTAYFALNNNEFANFVGNSNLKFSLKEGEDITYHELLMRCCELSGSCAYFDGDGYLSVAWYNDLMKNGSPETVLKLSASDRFSSDIYESANALSGIQYQKQDGTTVSVGTDSNPYIIKEQIFNPVSDDENININLFVQNLWTIRKGFSYTPFSATVKSFPNVFPLDKIKFVRNDGTEFETIVTHTVYKLNSNMDIEAVGETEEQAGYAKLAQMTAYEKAIIEKIAAQSAGKSAYEIAVEEGFVGTEEEWLESLNGESIAIKNLYKRFLTAQIGLQPPDSSTISSWSETPLSATSTYKYVYVTQGTYIDGVAQYDFSTPIRFSEYTKRVSSVVEEFIKTNSPSTAPSQSDSNWSTTVPDWEEGKYIWTRIKTTYTDSSIEHTTPTLATSINNAGRTAAAALDFNKVISSGMGLNEYVDQQTGSRYYYLGDSISTATYIVKFDSGGFAYSYNWNSGNPTWTYGIDRNGNAILNILTARKIQSDQIEAGAITAEKIEAGAITAEKIEAGAITTDKISSGAITAEKVEATGLRVDGSIAEFNDGVHADKFVFENGKKLEKVSNAVYQNVSVTIMKFDYQRTETIDGIDRDVYRVAVQLRSGGNPWRVPSASSPIVIAIKIKYRTNMVHSTFTTIMIQQGDDNGRTDIPIAYNNGIAPEIILCTSVPSNLNILQTSNSLDGIGSDCDFVPSDDNTYSLGYIDSQNASNSKRWKELRAGSSTIVTSDRKEKYGIYNISQKYSEMFDRLIPVQYKFINGSSGRTHIGFIAQDVERAMQESGLSGTDFAGLCVDGCQYGLRYEEFIALCVNEIQRLKARVEELEKNKTN